MSKQQHSCLEFIQHIGANLSLTAKPFCCIHDNAARSADSRQAMRNASISLLLRRRFPVSVIATYAIKIARLLSLAQTVSK